MVYFFKQRGFYVMKRSKKDNFINNIEKFWEQKLSFEFKIEQLRYKKLCEKLTKKEAKELDKTYYFYTYKDWEQHINNSIKVLNEAELIEYKHFLISKSRNVTFGNNMHYNFSLPFVSAVLASVLVNQLFNLIVYNGDNTQSVFIYLISIVIMFFCILFFMKYLLEKIIIDVQDSESMKNFYEDMIEIVNAHIEKK